MRLNDFAVEKLGEFLAKINDYEPKDTGLLESLILRLNVNVRSRIYAGEFFEILRECVKSQAEFLAKNARIKSFKGTRYEEEMLLIEHFTRQRCNELGIAWVMLGGQK